MPKSFTDLFEAPAAPAAGAELEGSLPTPSPESTGALAAPPPPQGPWRIQVPPPQAPDPIAELRADLQLPPAPEVDEQQQALDLCRRERFVNLSGTAGVGKTWVARALAEDDDVVLAATTGIAAVNLGEGTTINALLKYFDTASLKDAYTNGVLQTRLRALRRIGIHRIVLDEKSMLNGEQLDYLVWAIDQVNETKAYDEADAMGLILVGDFGQLPPVPDDDHLSQRKKAVRFAFEADEWQRFAANTVTLQRIRRQDSQEFIQALHAIRKGQAQQAMDFFASQPFNQMVDDTFEGTTIFAKNETVERFNFLRQQSLKTPTITYTTLRTGKPRGDWKLIPDELRLKEGSLVMILANHRVYDGPEDQMGRILYANGDLGYLRQDAGTAGWTVELHRGGTVNVLPITRHHLIPLEVGRRKQLTEELGAEAAAARISGRQEIIGTVSYMPIRCAYGCTVHKTQGLTLDKVQVNIRDPFFQQPGMLFVACSRARTVEGLRMVGTLDGFGARCTVNQKVQKWL